MRSARAYSSKTVNGLASQSVTVQADAASVTSGPVAGGVVGGLYGSSGVGGNMGGGIYRTSDAVSDGDVATTKFDDFFQYKLAQPVTIHKNESAMVPILQEKLPAERVTLWSPSESTPFRAIWLENSSKLTFDRGSFSIFESGVFAGQGLLDPIHPRRKTPPLLRPPTRPSTSAPSLRNPSAPFARSKSSRAACSSSATPAESRTTYIASNSAEEARVRRHRGSPPGQSHPIPRFQSRRNRRHPLSLPPPRPLPPIRFRLGCRRRPRCGELLPRSGSRPDRTAPPHGRRSPRVSRQTQTHHRSRKVHRRHKNPTQRASKKPRDPHHRKKPAAAKT